LRDTGVLEFVDAARQIKLSHAKARFQLPGAAGSENRSAIDRATLDPLVAGGVVEYLGTTNDVGDCRRRLRGSAVLPGERAANPDRGGCQ